MANQNNHLSKIEKVALYARVSTNDGRQDTENQLIQLREYCRKQGWAIAGEYVDHESGGTSTRAYFQQMFVDAHRRRFDLVAVLGRSTDSAGRGCRRRSITSSGSQATE
jgi:DNA invertase Pin-like site-specific DNA recombinase